MRTRMRDFIVEHRRVIAWIIAIAFMAYLTAENRSLINAAQNDRRQRTIVSNEDKHKVCSKIEDFASGMRFVIDSAHDDHQVYSDQWYAKALSHFAPFECIEIYPSLKLELPPKAD